MADFIKVVNPGMVEAYDRRGNPVKVRLWVCIKYIDGKLSITGVEGPTASGDAFGSCGQCGVDSDIEPSTDWTAAECRKLGEIWDRWHLNDMRPFSPEMKADGWDELASLTVWQWSVSLTTEAHKILRSIKTEAEAAAKAGKTWKASKAQAEVAKLGLIGHDVATYSNKPPKLGKYLEVSKDILDRSGGGRKPPKKTTLGWTKPSEHPEGLLGKKHPSDPDGPGYGGKWWHEDVPADILDWLRALPEPAPEQMPRRWFREEIELRRSQS
jgi:hypothetical protein